MGVKNEKKHVSFSNENEISGFFTDNDLKDQLEELKKLQEYQARQWKTQKFSHYKSKRDIITNNIQYPMNTIFNTRRNRNSRTKTLSTISRVNTRLPIWNKQKQKTYRNIGSMW